MNKLKKIAAAIFVLGSVFIAHGAFALTNPFTSTTSQTATDFTVNYTYTGTPTQEITVYSWLGVANSSTWIDQSNLLITIPESSTQITRNFSVDYNFSSLGLTGNGTQYVYYLADGPASSGSLIAGPAYFSVGTTTQVGDDDGTCNPIYDTTVSTPPMGSMPNLCSNGTMANFTGIDPVNGPWTWSCLPISSAGTTDTCTATLSTSGTQSGGINIAYQTGSVITNTTADIPILVSVGAQADVNLSTYLAPVGSVFTTGQPLLSQTITPNSPVNTTIHFTGLTAGQTYNYAIKNNTTGIYSPTVQFTTTGGATTNPTTTTTTTTPATTIPTITFPDSTPSTGLVPQCGRTSGAGTTMCTFNDFITLVGNVIQFGITMFFIFFAIMLIYAGFMLIYLGAKGDPGKAVEDARKKYGSMIERAIIGLIIIICAWTIISTILIALGVQHGYILLDIFNAH